MTELKFFEVRDRATHIDVAAFPAKSDDPDSKYILRHAGFGATTDFIILVRLGSGFQANYDAYKWGITRTMREAHIYIQDHWAELENGAVVDVEFILGESKFKKESERYVGYYYFGCEE